MDLGFLDRIMPQDHPAQGPPPDNPILRFNDSELGVTFSNILHSAGALLFTAGIALYLYQAHLLRRGRETGMKPSLGFLNYAHVSTILGIGMNGLGGVARLKQSGHPGLENVGDSPWVLLLLIKHLFLLVGVGLALFITWRTWSYSRAREPIPRLERANTRIIGMALASFLTIMLATVLGAMATVAPLGPGFEAMSGTAEGTHDVGPLLEPPGTDRLSVPGTIQVGTAANPEVWRYSFNVGNGRELLVAELNWTNAVATLSLALLDPDGARAQAETTRGSASIALKVAGSNVKAGTWGIEVRGEQALNERYQLTATASPGGATFLLVDRTEEIAPGRFFEANLEMIGPKSLNYSWEVVGSHEAKVFFDIHTHDPVTGETREPVAGEWNRLSGVYQHVREGDPLASLLWENRGTDPLTVRLRFWGHFAVDSFVPET